MRGSCILSRLLCYVKVALLSLAATFALGQQALHHEVSYEIYATCTNPKDNKPAAIDKYFISINLLALDKANSGVINSNNFNVSRSGDDIVQFHVEEDDLPFNLVIGPFEQSVDGIELSLGSLDNGLVDTLMIPGVLCGYVTHQGVDQPGYFCDGISSSVVAQASPHIVTNSSPRTHSNVYLLVDDEDVVRYKSFSGLFEEVLDQEYYEVQLYTIANHEVDAFYNEVQIDLPLTANPTLQCLALCGAYGVDVSCLGFDLALNKNVIGDDVYQIGDTVHYEVEVINEGSVSAYNVVIADMVPDGLIYLPEMNSIYWDEDAHSTPILTIPPGDTVKRVISLEVSDESLNIEIVNVAEIISASDADDDDRPAFDFDSTPDNDVQGEDDIDEAVISIFENLCSSTFDVRFDTNGPFCEQASFDLSVDIQSGTAPISFIWEFDGDTISRQQNYGIDNPQAEDFGRYRVTVIDANGCMNRRELLIESITDKRVSCINDLNLSIVNTCQIELSPDLLTLNDIPGIQDFLLEIRDISGKLIEENDISSADLSGPLEVKLINPCNDQVVCWSNINIEYKIDPQFNFYTEVLKTSCTNVVDFVPTDIIEFYNSNSKGLPVLSVAQYEEELLKQTCLADWLLVINDVSFAAINCGQGSVGRIYSAMHQDGRVVHLDTAMIAIIEEPIDDVIFPNDVSNISCDADVTPEYLQSVPFLVRDGDTVALNQLHRHQNNHFCNLAIDFTDQNLGGECGFGSQKIMRSWSIVDWCTNQVKSANQFLFVMDKEAPTFALLSDTLRVELAGFLCEGDIDLSGQIVIEDNCDPSPKIFIEDYSFDGYFIQRVPAGTQTIDIKAVDNCGNTTSRSIVVIVHESTPPVPVIIDGLSLTYTENSTMWIEALAFDNASGDACGPIDIKIARLSEVNEIMANGVLSTFEMRDQCEEGLSKQDQNKDGELTIDEIFRDKIFMCCSDIGTKVKVIIRIMDVSGNVSDIESYIEVISKSEAIPCDDGDPCTTNDVMVNGCPCTGIMDMTDRDQDNIIDCIDDDFIFCYNGETVSIESEDIDLYLNRGATPGGCDEKELASIGGYIRTWDDQMIEAVSVQLNQELYDSTTSQGTYVFPSLAMYESYELSPHKNDDILNGVSALDMVLIQQYLLGIADLESKIHLIAADINKDGRISAIDLAQLRKVLLGQVDYFPDNDSWVFLPEDPGLDENNPYQFDESIDIDKLDKDEMDLNWIGIKIGDVSGNVVANSLKSNVRDQKKIELKVNDIELKNGEEYVVPLKIAGTKDMIGCQLSLSTKNIKVIGVEAGKFNIGQNDFLIHDEGDVNIVASKYAYESEELFSILIRSNVDGRLSENLSISDGDIPSLIYDTDFNEYKALLSFSDASGVMQSIDDKLMSNQPNPFIDQTNIRFSLSGRKSIELYIYDMNGVLLKDLSGIYPRGLTEVKVLSDDLNTSANTIFIELKSGRYSSIRTAVIAR